MVKCNNNYVCEEDFFSMDEITDPSKCVAIEDNLCTTCDSISGARTANPKGFNDDPIYALFAKKSTAEETEAFWDTLTERCDIKRPATHGQKIESAFYVIEPDYDDLEHSTNISLHRIANLSLIDTNSFRFLKTINKIANTPRTAKHILQKDSDGTAYMAYLRELLQSDRCSSKLIHHANELPIGIGLFLHQLAIAKQSTFIKVIKFINTEPGACVEAVLEECSNILSRSNSSKSRSRSRSKSRSKSNSKSLKRAKSLSLARKLKTKRRVTI
jgi:hypothetical protein